MPTPASSRRDAAARRRSARRDQPRTATVRRPFCRLPSARSGRCQTTERGNVARQHVEGALAQPVVGERRAAPSPRPSARRAAARTGRGGPWRRASTALPSRSTVCCAEAIVAVGLNATRTTIGSPLLMPPCTPPERLVGGARPAVAAGDERVVVLAAGQARAGEAAADLEALRRRQRQHRPGEVGLELVEDRLAEPGRHAARDALDDAAERVAVAARARRCAPPCARPRPDRGSASASPRPSASVTVAGVDLRLDVVHLAHPREHLDAGDVGEQLARDRAGRDAADRLARARAAAALPVADAVLRLVGVVGVRRPVDVLHVLVGRRARVLVAHEQRDRRAERAALEHARQDLDAVRLLARRGEAALTGPAPVEVALDLGDVERAGAAGSRRRPRRRRRRATRRTW